MGSPMSKPSGSTRSSGRAPLLLVRAWINRSKVVALRVGGLSEFNSHAEVGMHDQHHAFGPEAHAGNLHGEDDASAQAGKGEAVSR